MPLTSPRRGKRLRAALLGGALSAAGSTHTLPSSAKATPAAEAVPAAAKTAAASKAVAPLGIPIAFPKRSWAVRFETLYQTPTNDIEGLKMNPWGLGFGGALSYSFKSGVFVGLSGAYFLGRTVNQTYMTGIYAIPVDAQSNLFLASFLLGADVDLRPLVLRYGFEIGVSSMSWDFGVQPWLAFAGYPSMKGSTGGLHVAPSISVAVPLGPFSVGASFRYILESSTQIPSSFGGSLLAEWRF